MRGALMETISIKHPDSESFIDAKLTEGKVTGANISLKISNDFMDSVKNDSLFLQHYPVEYNFTESEKEIINETESKILSGETDLLNKTITLKKGVYYKLVKGKFIWDKIVKNAWKSAEPGILFWDKIKTESIPDLYPEHKFTTVSTNPCSEITLCPYDSCRLTAINLYGYVVNPFTDEAYFDYELFKKDVILGQRIMDDIIDLEIEKIDSILDKIKSDPEPYNIKEIELDLWENIKNKAVLGRRTGLGITGAGDMLAALGFTYGSDEGNNFIENVMMKFKHAAYKSSSILAKERGTFPIYDKEREKNSVFLNRIKGENIDLYNFIQENGRRNIALLTVAPTGCLSEDSIIKTDNGNMSLGELFLLNGIDLNNLKGLKNQWIDVITDVFVSNIRGESNKITKLYWNGESKTKKMFLSDKTTIESTLEHKFLVKINENEAVWKKSCDLKKGDKIIKM